MTVITDETTLIDTGPVQAGWSGTWSGVSWSTVIAGAFTAIVVSIIVVALGSGIGTAVTSPYAYSSSPSPMTIIGALWLVFARPSHLPSEAMWPEGSAADRRRCIPMK